MGRERNPTGDHVAAQLRGMFEMGARAWPALHVSAEAFTRHIARVVPESSTPEAGHAELHAASLYLACACREQVPGAAEAFIALHGRDIDAALRGRRVPADARGELRQEILDKLLVDQPGRRARIGEYAGRGPLASWVRVAATRSALNFFARRSRDRLVPGAADGAADRSAPDPELAFLKSHYRREVTQALKDALAELPADERDALRLHFVDGLSIDRIAEVHGVHRATAARWMARGREALLRRIHALLGRRLDLEQSDVDSLVGLVRSQLDATVSSLFRRTAP